jgi:DNA (cytosine-5)-methyltransferase 1
MTRPPQIRASFEDELVVDSFAGGGGASTGIEAALGRPIDIAINHDAEAIAMHQANHPRTRHYCENVWEVDPVEACGGRPVGLAWFSPDCKHFSRAKGTALRDQKIRGLAWVVIRWARTVRPRVICLENVAEFQTWGPLDNAGQPVKEKAGRTFRMWVGKLRALGYQVEFRELVAADYGTPTTRRRLFMVARCDGQPIVWPAPSHGKGRAQKWQPAASIIDWSLPCPSIFGRSKPLAEATLRRIATGVERFVLGTAHPFVMKYHGGDAGQAERVHPLGEPLRTLDASNRFALVEPFLVRHGHYSTITGAGLREGCGAGTFRGQQLGLPLATVCATNDKHLVVPFIAKHYGGVVGHDARSTLGTVTAQDHHSLVEAFLIKYYGTGTPASAQLPLGTVTARDRFALVTVHGEPYRIVDLGMRMLQPHELFAAQGFPRDYDIAPIHNGKPLTKTAQTRLAGNSVCPQLSEAIVAANVPTSQERAA